MKSCLSLIFVLVIFVAIVGGTALIWYLSRTTEFSCADHPSATAPAR